LLNPDLEEKDPENEKNSHCLTGGMFKKVTSTSACLLVITEY